MSARLRFPLPSPLLLVLAALIVSQALPGYAQKPSKKHAPITLAQKQKLANARLIALWTLKPGVAKDNDGMTTLIAASTSGNEAIAQALLDKGADVNVHGNNLTALMAAASSGSLNLAQILITHGADVNAKDTNGQTALLLASLAGHADVVKLLLEHGADVNAKDNEGNTALSLAVKLDKSEIVTPLQSAGAK